MFIDIHTHILPFVDDGAKNWDIALEMLKHGENDGIVAAVATPHILSGSDFEKENEIIEKFHDLQRIIKEKNLHIKLYLGSELYFEPEIILNHTISTIGDGGKYFLVEFPLNNIPYFAPNVLFNLALQGKTAIIAHPERYKDFQKKPDLVYDYAMQGAILQLNAGSIIGKNGATAEKLAHLLISNNLAHIVASDCHDSVYRTMSLKQSYHFVRKKWGNYIADLLYFVNPQCVIKGQKIDTFDPIPVENNISKSIMKKIIYIKDYVQ